MEAQLPDTYAAIFREVEEEIRRRRESGKTEAHEDQLPRGTFLRAAEAMTRHARLLSTRGAGIFTAPAEWPFGAGTWKPPITVQEASRRAIVFLALEMAAQIRERERYPLDPTI